MDKKNYIQRIPNKFGVFKFKIREVELKFRFLLTFLFKTGSFFLPDSFLLFLFNAKKNNPGSFFAIFLRIGCHNFTSKYDPVHYSIGIFILRCIGFLVCQCRSFF